MKGQSAAKLIGKTFNKIKILSVSNRKDNKRSLYFNIKCLNCNKLSEMRSDRFTGLNKLKTCKYCRQENAIKEAKNRINPNKYYTIMYNSYKKNAIKANRLFLITKEEFNKIILQNCYYCGAEPIETATSKIYNRSNIIAKSNGIDRVNNNIGYINTNIVTCCTKCNMMKKTLKENEFINHIFKIYNYKKVQRLEQNARTLQANGNGNGENPKKD